MKAKNQEKKLQSRRNDYDRMKGDRHPGQGSMQQRIDNGGYHRPGSNKK